MKKKNKQYDVTNLEEELEILVAQDYRIKQFSIYHYRFNERLDVWPNTRKAYDIISRRKTDWRKSNIIDLVHNELKL